MRPNQELGREVCGPRYPQPALVDRRTGEVVEMLFSYRARLMDRAYLNRGASSRASAARQASRAPAADGKPW